MIYKDLGQLELAIRQFTTAAGKEPPSGIMHWKLGMLLREAGRPQEALTHLRKAAELSPEFRGPVAQLEAQMNGHQSTGKP